MNIYLWIIIAIIVVILLIFIGFFVDKKLQKSKAIVEESKTHPETDAFFANTDQAPKEQEDNADMPTVILPISEITKPDEIPPISNQPTIEPIEPNAFDLPQAQSFNPEVPQPNLNQESISPEQEVSTEVKENTFEFEGPQVLNGMAMFQGPSVDASISLETPLEAPSLPGEMQKESSEVSSQSNEVQEQVIENQEPIEENPVFALPIVEEKEEQENSEEEKPLEEPEEDLWKF